MKQCQKYTNEVTAYQNFTKSFLQIYSLNMNFEMGSYLGDNVRPKKMFVSGNPADQIKWAPTTFFFVFF